MVHGKFSGSFQRLAPVARKSCGTFFALRYFWIAALVAVPSEPEIASTWSCSTSWRVCSTVLGGL